MPNIVDSPFVGQPQTPVQLSQKWLDRGLQFVNFGNGLFWSRDRGWFGRTSTAGGPKLQSSKYGVVTGFGAAYGSGTTDIVYAGKLPRANLARSWVGALYANSTGAAGLGRVFQDVSGNGLSSNTESVYYGNTGILFNVLCNGIGGQYTVSSPPAQQWYTFGFSFLLDFPANPSPDMYIDGASVSVNVNQAANSTYGVGAVTDLAFGNRPSDSARSFDGMHGPMLWFDGYLTPQEHKSLNNNIWQIIADEDIYTFFSAGGVIYPASDITTTGWTATPGPTYFGMLDELITDDGDIVTSPLIDTTQGPLIMGLSDVLAAGPWDINIRTSYLGSASQVRCLLLDSGGSTVGTSSWQILTGTLTDYVLPVTTSGIAARIRIEVQ